jgi:hypothetical protein
VKTKLSLIVVSILFFLSCSNDNDPCDDLICNTNEICNEGICESISGYSGTPFNKIYITKIKLLRFPSTRFNGNKWDSLDNADLHITLYQSSNKVWSISNPIVNAENIAHDIQLLKPIELIDPDKLHTFSMYDDDGNLIDEFMAGVIFTPYEDNNSYPKTIQIDTQGLIAFEINLKYQ